jgi:GNAT superfamily N-acetyltransferase
VKTLSVKQPWAELIAQGIKTVELRTWATTHRGPLLIAAGQAYDARGAHHNVDGPRGVACCTVALLACRPALIGDAHNAGVPALLMADLLEQCDARGRALYAWVLADARRANPVPIRGQLSLYETPDTLFDARPRTRAPRARLTRRSAGSP